MEDSEDEKHEENKHDKNRRYAPIQIPRERKDNRKSILAGQVQDVYK